MKRVINHDEGKSHTVSTGSFITDIKEIRRKARQHLDEGAVTANYNGKVEDSIAILNQVYSSVDESVDAVQEVFPKCCNLTVTRSSPLINNLIIIRDSKHISKLFSSQEANKPVLRW